MAYHVLRVEKDGSGDHTTIEAACAAAVTAGATTGSYDNAWQVEVGLGTYAPSGGLLTVPAGVKVRGKGMFHTSITGKVTLNDACALDDVLVDANGLDWGVRCILNGSAERIYIRNVYVYVNKAVASQVIGITYEGTGVSQIIRVMNCFVYARNLIYNGAAGGEAICHQIKSSAKIAVELLYTHNKTSKTTDTSGTNTAKCILADVQGDGAETGIYGICDWWAIWDKNPTLLRNANPNYKGGFLFCPVVVGEKDLESIQIENSHIDWDQTLYSLAVNRLSGITVLQRTASNVMYTIYPTIAGTSAPTVSTPAPDGTTFLVPV